jgi:hypothetical protein
VFQWLYQESKMGEVTVEEFSLERGWNDLVLEGVVRPENVTIAGKK